MNEKTPQSYQNRAYEPVPTSEGLEFEDQTRNHDNKLVRTVKSGLFKTAGLMLLSAAIIAVIFAISSQGKDATIPNKLAPEIPAEINHNYLPVAKLPKNVKEGAAWSSKFEPYSTVDPSSLGFRKIYRPAESKPGPVWGAMLINSTSPLPTNAWYQNLLLGENNRDPENKVFQVPYVIDTAGAIIGLRTHGAYVQSSDKIVMVRLVFVSQFVDVDFIALIESIACHR